MRQTALVAGWVAAALFLPSGRPALALVPSGLLEIHTINVQQGASTLVIGPDGTTVLLDAGRSGKGTARIVPYLASIGLAPADGLDHTLASHMDADHIGGFDEVFAAGYDVEEANWFNGSAESGSTIDAYKAAAAGTTAGAPQAVPLGHWQRKLAEHAPDLTVEVFHGPQRDLRRAAAARVVLTSYGVLRSAAEVLAGQPFALAVFDEAQQLKNRDTQGHRAARALAVEIKVGLSGTPVENDASDLEALLDLVLPGALFGYLPAAGRETARPAAVSALRRAARPFVLRRLKSEVLSELPEKIDDLRGCRLSEEQAALYREVAERQGKALVEQLRRAGEPVPYLHVFAVLNLLKRICDHPALALGRPEAWREHGSGKWDLFCELLDEALGSRQKVVVFSQYLGMIDIMERHLVEQGVGHVTLTGASRKRAELVDRFNGDDACRVFLGSLKAGGTGIDLVAGSVVIHYDRWWNAAREDQATDRVHRIGQRRAVQVLRLLAEDTLETRIDSIIARKRRLLDEVVEADAPELARVFSREELIELLAPGA